MIGLACGCRRCQDEPRISDILQNIQEERDDTGIEQVSKHSADDGHNEEGLDGIAVLIAHGTHVGHSIGRGTETEAAHACTEHT